MRFKSSLKKAVSLILALAMTVSLAVVGAAAAEMTFKDVPESLWCHDSVIEAVNKGFMSGYGGGMFGPADAVTRGQVAQILYNKYGKDCGSESGFSDVPSGFWCAKAVTWAVQNKIVSGYPDGTYKPSTKLTRQHLVSILYNHAGKPSVSGNLNKFTDKDQVASYAKDAFIWATENGIVGGTTATTLSPNGLANRGQVATIILRYDKMLNEKDDGGSNSSGGSSSSGSDSGTTSGGGSTTNPDKDPKPAQPTTPGTSAEVMKNLPEDEQKILKKVGATTLTTAESVNTISNVGKSNEFPTFGYTETANVNGYHTEATIDVSGAVLDYDVLDILNKYREDWFNGIYEEHGSDKRYDAADNITWTTGDVAEECILACAKYPKAAETMYAITIRANSKEELIKKLTVEEYPGTDGPLAREIAGRTTSNVIAAHFTDKSGNTTYAFYYNSDGNDFGSYILENGFAKHNYMSSIIE